MLLSRGPIWWSQVGKPHPVGLRERVVAFVEEWHSQRSAGARFPAPVTFVNDMVILKRETGGLRPRRQGNGGGPGKPEPVRNWLEARIALKGELPRNFTAARTAPPRVSSGAGARPGPPSQRRPWKCHQHPAIVKCTGLECAKWKIMDIAR